MIKEIIPQLNVNRSYIVMQKEFFCSISILLTYLCGKLAKDL